MNNAVIKKVNASSSVHLPNVACIVRVIHYSQSKTQTCYAVRYGIKFVLLQAEAYLNMGACHNYAEAALVYVTKSVVVVFQACRC